LPAGAARRCHGTGGRLSPWIGAAAVLGERSGRRGAGDAKTCGLDDAGRDGGAGGLRDQAGAGTRAADGASATPAGHAAAAAASRARGWRDLSLSPGDWSYAGGGAGSEARFGPADGAASFVLRCDLARRRVALVREGAPATAALRVTTSAGTRTLAAGAPLAAADSFLDAIAFSRGRFTVEADGAPRLVLPAWPEPARVIEDCRV
jgi:hypothetical protein